MQAPLWVRVGPLVAALILVALPQGASGASPSLKVTLTPPYVGTVNTTLWPTNASHYGCHTAAAGKGAFNLTTGKASISEAALALKCRTASTPGNASVVQVVQFESTGVNLVDGLHRFYVNWTYTGTFNLTARGNSSGAFAYSVIFLNAWLTSPLGPSYFTNNWWKSWSVGVGSSNHTINVRASQNVSTSFYGYTYGNGTYYAYVQFEIDSYAYSGTGGAATARVQFAGPGQGGLLRSITIL